jgi:ABC-type ATPase involved in cell division
MQIEGLFDLPPQQQACRTWQVELPLEQRPWNIGLIVGPSGCGKSTVAQALFGEAVFRGFEWPKNQSILDGFPAQLRIKAITAMLTSVGFSSVPTWLRPFGTLSNGEQFRASVARAILEAELHRKPETPSLVVIDEFTSVVDRTVARIGSAAVAKAIRRMQLQFIAVTCHYDVIDWLQPDWQYEPATGVFSWRCLQRRPAIDITITRTSQQTWRLFHHHHYLDTSLAPSARCFLGTIENQPAVFSAVLPFPHPTRPGWREHRTVCLPDFQGVGIGNAFSEYVASLFQSTGKPYRSVTGNPAMIRHRARSPLWIMTRPPSQVGRSQDKRLRRTSACDRITASFEYVGPSRQQEAIRFGIR